MTDELYDITPPRLCWRGWYVHALEGSVIVGTRTGFTRRQAVRRAARLFVAHLSAAAAPVVIHADWCRYHDDFHSRASTPTRSTRCCCPLTSTLRTTPNDR